MKLFKFFSIFLLPIAGHVLAQQANINLDWKPQHNTEGLLPYGAAVNSPEVHDNHTVTFRLRAPGADSVALTGGSLLTALENAGEPMPLARGENGMWTLTVGPLRPDIYSYHFLIDGAQVADPGNSLAAIAAAPVSSRLVIHGDGPAWYDARNVPHGKITRHVYHSDVTAGERELYVYTPPGYDASHRYPVLYLLGGSSSLASDWLQRGRINFIMDNLLAEGAALPMIIAMPNNQVIHRSDPRHAKLTFDIFERELREHVIPLMDREYATQATPQGRALSGLSMGGRHSMFVGLRSLDLFASLGILSAGDETAENTLAEFLNDPQANNKIDYLFVGQGGAEATAEFFNLRVAALVDALEAHDIEHEYYVGSDGGHDWTTWRHLLYYRFLPKLWRQQ